MFGREMYLQRRPPRLADGALTMWVVVLLLVLLPLGVFGQGVALAPQVALKTLGQSGDVQSNGQNPWVDIRAFGARAFTAPATSTTASCKGTTTVTLTSAIDFINGDGIVLHRCGPATSLTTPAAPVSVTPKGILNGTTTRSYKIVAEDYSLGMTAASPARTITSAALAFGTTTATIISANVVDGLLTATTSTNHNFEVGTVVKISGATVGANPVIVNGIWIVQTTPSATTFTVLTYYRPDNWAATTNGTAEAPAHNWVKWTAQNNVMRYWVYRQDGGSGAYNLVGVAQGMEPFFDDYGFTVPNNTNMPEVPSTAPSTATNQALATSIVSGGGTTSIVVANAATSTISGVSALHDNTLAYNAALTAAYTNGGGAIYVPNAGLTNCCFVMNFPLVMPSPSNSGVVTHKISGPIWAYQPIVPSSFTAFEGFNPHQSGTPSFATTNYGTIFGTSYPLMFISLKGGVDFDKMYLVNSVAGAQAWTLLIGEGTVVGGGVSNTVTIRNSNITSNAITGAALVTRGVGFGFTSTNTVYGINGFTAAQYYYQPAVRIMCSGVAQNGSPGIGLMRDVTFLGSGVLVDCDAIYPTNAIGLASQWQFQNIFSESTVAPIFQFRNINSNNWYNWTIDHMSISDILVLNTPAIDMTSPTIGSPLVGLRLSKMNGGGTGGSGVNIGAGASLVTFLGETTNDQVRLPSGSALIYANQANVGTGNVANIKTFETSGAIRLKSPAPLFVEGQPPSSLTIAVSAGGNIPVGTYNYAVTAVDVNGGESVVATANTQAVITGRNQTVTVNWTAPAIPPASYNVYRGPTSSGSLANGRVNTTPITTTSFVDTFALANSGLAPYQSGGGPIGMSAATGLWTNKLLVGGGTNLVKYSRFSVSLSPAQVTANTCASQSFTVTGIAAADILIGVVKPTEQAGLSLTPGHVTGANTATINFCNNTGAGITPKAAETYQFVTVQ